MHDVVSREEWIERRKALLAKEKEWTRQRDALSAERRELPWVKVEQTYTFDGPKGPVTLSDLFDGHQQLFVKHFMHAPGQRERQCVGCSFEADHVNGILVHLRNNGVSYAAIGRAPIEEIEELRTRMGWTFPFVSSYRNTFNYDFDVSFKPEDVAAGRAYYNYEYTDPGNVDRSGNSVFIKDENGQIYHTYSTYGRGVEATMGMYGMLDMMPMGRNESERGVMLDWLRPHDKYGQGGTVTDEGRYHKVGCACGAHTKAAGA
jgi:predicted dithiol-disulfide oxidoreductase (DUF899 family)